MTPFDGDWYTQAKKETMTEIVRPLARSAAAGSSSTFGEVSVTEQVVGYQRKSIATQETIDTIQLDLPQTSFETEAVWFLPEPRQLRRDRRRCRSSSRRCTRPSTR